MHRPTIPWMSSIRQAEKLGMAALSFVVTVKEWKLVSKVVPWKPLQHLHCLEWKSASNALSLLVIMLYQLQIYRFTNDTAIAQYWGSTETSFNAGMWLVLRWVPVSYCVLMTLKDAKQSSDVKFVISVRDVGRLVGNLPAMLCICCRVDFALMTISALAWNCSI